MEEQLAQAGIVTADELRKNRAKAAWLKIRQIDPSACIHPLLALDGVIEGVQKSLLHGAVKADLKPFISNIKCELIITGVFTADNSWAILFLKVYCRKEEFLL